MAPLILIFIGFLALLGGRFYPIYAGTTGFMTNMALSALLFPDQGEVARILLALLAGLLCAVFALIIGKRIAFLWAMAAIGGTLALLVDPTPSPLWLHLAILITGTVFGLLLYLLSVGWSQSLATALIAGTAIGIGLNPVFPDLTAPFTFLVAAMITLLGLLLQLFTTTRAQTEAGTPAI
jgi:hypothetical protein